MSTLCASCGAAEGLKQCGRCKQISYCSPDCQKADWKLHKKVCRFDNLLHLRQMVEIPAASHDGHQHASGAAIKVFNTAKTRMAIFSFLPAKELLTTQRVCRSWYCTVALEKILQQRLFFEPEPGSLVLAAYQGGGVPMGIQPRNKSQLDHVKMSKGGSFASPVHLIRDDSDALTKEISSAELEKAKIKIILNPFFTKLWPQDPKNMTNSPYITTSLDNKIASWRRMQLTSPPMKQLDLSVWYTDRAGKGNQLRPGTGPLSTGATLGHLADLLASSPKKFTLHWMSIDGHVWWARSADAVVLPVDGQGGKNEPMRGVYVNPSNGIAFPGAF